MQSSVEGALRTKEIPSLGELGWLLRGKGTEIKIRRVSRNLPDSHGRREKENSVCNCQKYGKDDIQKMVAVQPMG